MQIDMYVPVTTSASSLVNANSFIGDPNQDPLFNEGRILNRKGVFLNSLGPDKERKESTISSQSKSTTNNDPSRTPSPKLSPKGDHSDKSD